MVEIKPTTYQGYDVIEVANSTISLLATVSKGPRILSLSAFGSQNLFAELPGVVLEYPGDGDLEIIGGHRLWYAPENPATTYTPDSKPVSWTPIENGIKLVQETDFSSGIQKEIEVLLANHEPRVTVIHYLHNQGDGPVQLAPWAITQLRPGGRAVIPQKTGDADPFGLLPNRNIVLWPYTDIKSENISLENNGVYVNAKVSEGPLKLGLPNPLGWIAYSLGGLLFVKRAQYFAEGNYLDKGASSQIYCNPDFIELETLGPAVNLEPGESVSHQEEWEIFEDGNWPEDIQALLG